LHQIAALKPEARTSALSPRMTGASAQEEIDEPDGELSPRRSEAANAHAVDFLA